MNNTTGKRDKMIFDIDMDLIAYDSYDDIKDVIDDIIKACNINTKDSSIPQYYDHDGDNLTAEFITKSGNKIYIEVDAPFDKDGGPRGISASDYIVKFNGIDKTDDAIAMYKKNTGENDKLLYPFDIWVPDFLKKYDKKPKAIKPVEPEEDEDKTYRVYTKEKGLIKTNEYSEIYRLTWHREDGPAYIKYFDTGKVQKEEYYLNGKLHFEDGPALIEYYESGKVQKEKYYLNGKNHRKDGPAVIYYYESGKIKNEIYYINDKRHRNNGPSLIEYYESGKVQKEEYNGENRNGLVEVSYYESGEIKNEIYKNGEHTEEVNYYKSGKIDMKSYYINNARHRDDGPATISYYESGKIRYETYCINNKRHRDDGPALIDYHQSGEIGNTYYYLYGKELSFDEWKEHPLVKAKTIEVDSKKELDALAKKDKEGTKTDDYFISTTGKYPIVYTLKESKVFESFKEVYVNKNKHTISREIRQMIDKDKNFGQFVNENYYRDNTYKLGKFLKQQFPNVEFIWDEDSKGWWTTDEKFLNKYSSERTSYNYDAEEELKRVFRSQNRGQKLIVNSDFDKIQITLD